MNPTYNRYQGNTGRYERRAEASDAPASPLPPSGEQPPERASAVRPQPSPAAAGRTKQPPGPVPGLGGVLDGLLGKPDLARLETGDLMLALLFYLLYRESGDKEFLFLAGGMVLL